jgi:uncharacterized protein YciI
VALWAIVSWDAPDAPRLRKEHLAAHLAHVEGALEPLKLAGPLRTTEGGFAGSLGIVEADSAEIARAFIEADPYFRAGVWARCEVFAFNAAAGEWVGGISWTPLTGSGGA